MANIAAHLEARAAERGDHVALVCGRAEITFRELWIRASRVAAGLLAAGFGAGDKLALLVSSRPEFILFEQAAFALGGVLVPLNIHYRPPEIEAVLASCDVDFLVIEQSFRDRIPEQVGRWLPALRGVFVVDPAPAAVAPGSGARDARELLDCPRRIPALVDRPPDEVALILHTSATTGSAKGVLLTLANLEANYDRTPGWLGLGADDCILCALPLHNTFALNQCINATFVTGARMVLLPRFDALECLQTIQQWRCTFFPAVPTMLQKILYDPRVSDFDLSSVRRLLVGAAPVPAPLLERIYRIIGNATVVMTGYGLTEATALVSLEHVELGADGRLRRPMSVGRPLPGMEMKVVDHDGGELPPGKVGEIWIRGPNVMKGYYKKPEDTAQAVIDGWLRTGDLAKTDAEGYFYIVDRKKDLIIRGGQNVYPSDIEAVLYAHPAVAEVAVVGQPDEVFGEAVEAYVALKPGRTVTAEALIERCCTELAYFKVPGRIHFLAELPKGPTGKILRRQLVRTA